jgi:hypothetical protein
MRMFFPLFYNPAFRLLHLGSGAPCIQQMGNVQGGMGRKLRFFGPNDPTFPHSVI